jgi:hypothetical protein
MSVLTIGCLESDPSSNARLSPSDRVRLSQAAHLSLTGLSSP